MADFFGEDVAARYDDSQGPAFDPVVIEQTVGALEQLAAGGAAVEFAVGTGRIALPLADRGVPVSGIELSEPMAQRLRAKDPTGRVAVSIGDMTTARVPGDFTLVYLVYNTIGNLLSQDEQVACFANAAAHLHPGGRFLIELAVPALRRLPPTEDAVVFAHRPGYVGFDVYEDLATQRAVSHHFVADGSGVTELRSPFRFVWPSELDLMARLAGMHLLHRWSDWEQSPFTNDSVSHVSVWEKR